MAIWLRGAGKALPESSPAFCFAFCFFAHAKNVTCHLRGVVPRPTRSVGGAWGELATERGVSRGGLQVETTFSQEC